MHQQSYNIIPEVVLTNHKTIYDVRIRTHMLQFRSELSHFNNCILRLQLIVLLLFMIFGMRCAIIES